MEDKDFKRFIKAIAEKLAGKIVLNIATSCEGKPEEYQNGYTAGVLEGTQLTLSAITESINEIIKSEHSDEVAKEINKLSQRFS